MTDLLHKARHKSPSEAGSSPLPPPSNSGPCFRALSAHLGPRACLSPWWGTDACTGRALPAFQRAESCRREPRLHITWQGLSRLISGTKLTDGDNAQKSPGTWQMQPALLMHFNKMSIRYTHVIIYSINSHFFTQCFPWGQPFLWYLHSETALQACLHHATGKPSGKIYGTYQQSQLPDELLLVSWAAVSDQDRLFTHL